LAVDAYLNAHPRDAKGRFLKGLIQTEQNKPNEAIETFVLLTRDYPSLPEPYNNLAVLYASLGHYDKALAALETAIRTHPSYAIAHENLGDVYAQLASQAYDKALQLDKKNSAAQTKLALIKDLFSQESPALRPVVVARTAPKPLPETSKPIAETSKPVVDTSTFAKTTLPAVTTAPASNAGDAEKAQILKAVHSWAQAWSNKDVNAYLASYAPNFKTPDGEGRNAWEASRRERILRPKQIQVRVLSPNVSVRNDGTAEIRFVQEYKSDTLNRNVRKSLILTRSENKWLILREKVGQ
jgi:tetratricopeptide (TPR) repeat protein